MSDKPERHDLQGRAGHQPKPAIWFLALPFLVLFMVLRPVGCGFVWLGRFLRWLVRPKSLLGLAFLLLWIAVFHVLWFSHGWSTFRPLCWHDEGYTTTELTGPMTVEATAEFHDFFVSWLGPDSVRRFGDHQIDVRPVLRMIPTSYLWNISRQTAEVMATRRGVVGRPERDTEMCGFIEEMLMEGGKASRHSEGWGYWPYNAIDEDSPFGEYLTYYHQTDPASP